VVLGEVIAVKTQAIVSLGKPQPIGIERAERNTRIVHMVEHAEFHDRLPSLANRTPKRLWPGRARP
jgi:hypothetical protein